MRLKHYAITFCVGLLLGLSALLPYMIYTAMRPATETPAPQVAQADGSIVLERKPDSAAKPKAQIPKGGKVERVIGVTVRGQGIKLPDMSIAPCPPASVELSLVRMGDNTRRVVASSPDGEILSGLDVPIESVSIPPAPKAWAAGLSLNPVRQTFGVWIERDISRLRVGAEINQTRMDFGPTGIEARVKLGMTF